MAILSGKHLPRRTFLRGMGATVALPLLDAMVPAGRLGTKVLAATETIAAVRRLYREHVPEKSAEEVASQVGIMRAGAA